MLHRISAMLMPLAPSPTPTPTPGAGLDKLQQGITGAGTDFGWLDSTPWVYKIFGLLAAGVVVWILATSVLVGAYQIGTAKGDVKKVARGRETIKNGVTGIVMALGAATLLIGAVSLVGRITGLF